MDLWGDWVKEFGKTVLMVTHDPAVARRAQATLHLEKGSLVGAVEGVGAPMKFLPLVIANLFRKKDSHRADHWIFTVALVSVRIAGDLSRGAFSQGVDIAGADRLVIINRLR